MPPLSRQIFGPTASEPPPLSRRIFGPTPTGRGGSVDHPLVPVVEQMAERDDGTSEATFELTCDTGETQQESAALAILGDESLLSGAVALDCEMVRVARNRKALARVAVVDFHERILLDTFVRPAEPVVDFETRYSGRPAA